MKIQRFKCKHCSLIQDTTLWERIKHPHLFGKKLYLKCPRCGWNWHTRI